LITAEPGAGIGGEGGFEVLEHLKQGRFGPVVGGLVAGKATAVNAIIHSVLEPFTPGVTGGRQPWRGEIWGAGRAASGQGPVV
jgi:hypothetical protein